MDGVNRKAFANAGHMFSPSVSRSTSCVVLKHKATERVHLVVSLSARSDSQVISISPSDGRLRYSNKEGESNFASEGDALDYLSDIDSIEILERGCALLGYATIGNFGIILLATRLRDSAVLPGGHQVRLIAESKWVMTKLQEYDGAYMSPAEVERMENLQSYALNNAHYLCETADITRPFPSSHPVSEPSWEFAWNRWMTQPFREIGLESHCPHLLQGVVESRVLEDADSQKYILILISRRSRLHPGMRYIARGLNGLASPGNEIECEQLLLTCPEKGQPLKWSTYIWRRGTVPIWWSVELKQGGVGEATINVNARTPYRGTRRYFRRLQKRYLPDLGLPPHLSKSDEESENHTDPDNNSPKSESSDPSLKVRVVCVNLLRCNMQRRDELLLSEHFSEGVRRVRKNLPGSSLRVLNFDWHGMMKDLKEDATVEGFWSLLESFFPQGTLYSTQNAPNSGRESQEAFSKNETIWVDKWHVTHTCEQQGIVRYNCADSLDRTNAASYFGAVQVLAEQARRLGLRIENHSFKQGPQDKPLQNNVRGKQRDLNGALEISNIHQRVRKFMATRGGESQAENLIEKPETLPFGWEERLDPGSGRKFYIDHTRKRTTWEKPASPSQEQSMNQDKDLAHLLNEPRPQEGNGQATDENKNGPKIEKQSRKVPSWGLLGLSVAEMRQILRADVVAAQAEIFLVNGDINSNLYTSTRAMHSAILGLLQGEGGAVSKAGVGRLANLGVTLQRRWANVLSDFTRQTVVECFLGLRLKDHFPNLTLTYPGEQGVPMENDNEEDEQDLDESPPATLRDKGTLPPDLTNQANIAGKDQNQTGDEVPVEGELKPSISSETKQNVSEVLEPKSSVLLGSSKVTGKVRDDPFSASDPGTFLSRKVSGEGFEARKSSETRDSLI